MNLTYDDIRNKPSLLDKLKDIDSVMLICNFCGKKFPRTKKMIKRTMAKGPRRQCYCGSECSVGQRKKNSKPPIIEINCAFCETPFKRKRFKSTRRREAKHFCSKKCRVKFHSRDSICSEVADILSVIFPSHFPNLHNETNKEKNG